MKSVPKYFLISVSLFLFSCLTPSVVKGQKMSSPNYKIEGGNLNSSAASQNSSGYRLIDLVGQTSASIFTAKGYIINSGFFNKASGGALGLSLDKSSINFENISPDIVYTENIRLTVTNSDFPGYSLYASEITPLTTNNDAEIPDTVCDAVKNRICTTAKGNTWQNKSSFGFGYNLNGKNTVKDFAPADIFRPFPRLDSKQPPALVAASQAKKSSDVYDLNLKLIVSRSQPVGIYKNILNLSLVPGY